jgi:hypothetical protein
MQIERITVGRVRSIPGEYGNRKMEMTAILNPDEDAKGASLRLAGYIDQQLIAAEEQEKLIEEEAREQYEKERKHRTEQRKLDARRLYLTPTVRIHQRANEEWMVIQELEYPINKTFVLSRTGEWVDWSHISESRIREVAFATEEEARTAFDEHPAIEPVQERVTEEKIEEEAGVMHDPFTDA